MRLIFGDKTKETKVTLPPKENIAKIQSLIEELIIGLIDRPEYGDSASELGPFFKTIPLGKIRWDKRLEINGQIIPILSQIVREASHGREWAQNMVIQLVLEEADLDWNVRIEKNGEGDLTVFSRIVARAAIGELWAQTVLDSLFGKVHIPRIDMNQPTMCLQNTGATPLWWFATFAADGHPAFMRKVLESHLDEMDKLNFNVKENDKAVLDVLYEKADSRGLAAWIFLVCDNLDRKLLNSGTSSYLESLDRKVQNTARSMWHFSTAWRELSFDKYLEIYEYVAYNCLRDELATVPHDLRLKTVKIAMKKRFIYLPTAEDDWIDLKESENEAILEKKSYQVVVRWGAEESIDQVPLANPEMRKGPGSFFNEMKRRIALSLADLKAQGKIPAFIDRSHRQRVVQRISQQKNFSKDELKDAIVSIFDEDRAKRPELK